MIGLDYLAEIADGNAFGCHAIEYCGGGHLWTDQTTRWYRDGRKIRRICRTCDAARIKLKHKPVQCLSISPSIAPGIAQAGATEQ